MNDDLSIKIGARAQEASKVLKELANDVKKLGDSTKQGGNAAAAGSLSFGKLAGSFTVATIAAQAITAGLALVRDEINKSIKASNEYSSAMIGLSSVAGAFGESQSAARDAAKSLAQDGLMSVTEAANGLKNLLGAGFGLPEAITLMEGFKDSAAFNRQGSLEFGQAIVGATEGIKNQNSVLVDNAGITKNLSVILKEQGLSVEDLGKVSSDAGVRQKLYNGILKETGIFSGDATRYSDTLGGSQQRLGQSVNNLRIMLGQALSPALKIVIGGLSDLVSAIATGAQPHMASLAKFCAALATAFQIAGSAIVRTAQGIISVFGGVAKAQMQLFSGDVKGAFNSMKNGVVGAGTAFNNFTQDVGKSTQRFNETVADINKNGLSGIGDITREAVDRTTGIMDKGAKKMAEDIAKTNREFAQAMEKQTRQFDQSLKDMVIAHREKTQQLEKDMADENTDFDDRMKERVSDHRDAMRDIEKQHAEKVRTIQKQMEDEREKVEEQIDEITKKNAEPMEQFRIAAQERLSSLQGQLDEELAKGKNANNKKVTNLQEIISKEKNSLDAQQQFRLDQIEEEKQEIRDKSSDKIKSLEEELAEEVINVKTASEEKQAEYEKETAKLTAEHSKRLASLQTQLDTERAIQMKYADDFARFKDAVAEDDITRLKREHAEQRAEAEREHQEKLQDLARRSQEEIATKQAAAVRTNSQMASNINNAYQTAKQTTTNKASTIQLSSGFSGGSSGGGGGGGGGSSWGGTSTKSSGNVFTAIGGAISGAFNGIKGLFGFAEGGIVTRPTAGIFGEAGPEALIPLSKPARANEILNASGLNRGQTQINMPVTVMSSEVDIDRLVERLAYKLNREGIL